jgi:hypothetical protein
LRANSSKTRCWYSISVTNRAAWKRRSPAQPSPSTGTFGPPAGVGFAGFQNAFRSAMPSGDVSVARVFLMSSIRRSCSEWKTWWIVVSAMFSFARPSPAQKCVSSSSSS